jgi:multicomponent Na+:H+ antiporter subunit D
MGVVGNIYFIIFLPLIFSLFCRIFTEKIFAFLVTIICLAALLFLTLRIYPDLLIYQKITNKFDFSPFSLALEFNLDLTAATFIILLLFAKIVILLFYHADIKKAPDNTAQLSQIQQKSNLIKYISNLSNFYPAFLLQLFSLTGIFTTDNLLNLFLFFEIYALSFFAIATISNDSKLLKLVFRYFVFSAVSGLLILFCFLVIYLTFGSTDFSVIYNNLSLINKTDQWFLPSIFLLLGFAFIARFLPLWLYFAKTKNSDPLASFLISDALFVKTGLGIFLIIKFIYFFFGNQPLFDIFSFKLILIPAAILLIFYSSIKLYYHKYLRLIAIYFCLNNLGFILIAIAFRTVESLQALFFYLLNFNLVNLTIFIFVNFLQRRFSIATINQIGPGKIDLTGKNYLSSFLPRKIPLKIPLKILLFLLITFRLIILFFANWYLIYASLNSGFEILILITFIFSSLAHLFIVTKLISSFLARLNFSGTDFIGSGNANSNSNKSNSREGNSEEGNFEKSGEISGKISDQKILNLTSIAFLILAIYLIFFFCEFTNNLSLKFASYLL